MPNMSYQNITFSSIYAVPRLSPANNNAPVRTVTVQLLPSTTDVPAEIPLLSLPEPEPPEPRGLLPLEPVLPAPEPLEPTQSATCCRPTSGMLSHHEGGEPLLPVPVLPVPPQSATYCWLASGM
eukprot:TRINITY_DN1013_c0_g1_i2.p1 TRINITY_DN1013_c0_g1~~TRINITY_DN1013_c0_g1_i2.p1  ORF type:complete len:124 (-),score=15.05 TRINITY_DN1013_c0_g1_i2:266-637(-)